MSVKKNNSKVFESLDEYFSTMDQALIGGNSIFSDQNAKERHESILMYAFRKYRAACYHIERVKRLMGDAVTDPIYAGDLNDKHLPNGTEAMISVTMTADHFIYELAAFFEATKSSLDFIATACNGYVKGMTTDSIQSFIRCVDRGSKKGQLFDVTKRHLSWLKEIRDYRHHLVHRMVITTSIGHEVHKRGKLIKRINHPVVVPKSTPSYFPDTRRSRLIQEEMTHLDCTRFEGTVEYPDATKEIADFSIKYSPSTGYAEISEFMALHLRHLEDFFCAIIAGLKSMNFMKCD